jgi:hypothetical protein
VTVSRDDTARLWDIAARRVVAVLRGHTDDVWFATFTPDGERLATAGHDGTVRLWTSEGVLLRVLDHSGVELRVLAFSADGSRLAAGGDDGVVTVWDTASGRLLVELVGHTARIRSVLFARDGRRIVTSADDKTVRVWDRRDGRLLHNRVGYGDSWIAFEPGGHYIRSETIPPAQVLVSGALHPIDSYDPVLRRPDRVREAIEGGRVEPPFLPTAPEIEWIAPTVSTLESRKTTIDVRAGDRYGLRGVQVYQDGEEIPASTVGAALAVEPGSRTARLKLPLSIPAGATSTSIRVIAENERGIRSRPRSMALQFRAPERELYLLAMGVGDYEDDRLDLRYPVADVDDIIAAFRAQEGAFYGKVHVERIVDADLSIGSVRRARDRFLLQAKPDDTIVVFAAGHGVRTDTDEYWFLTHGATPADPYDGIDRRSLEQLVTWDRLHSRKRVMFLDTCHSGGAFGLRGAPRGIQRIADDEADRVRAGDREGIYIVAASADDEFAREQGGNGVFTRALLDAISKTGDGDGDGLVQIEEMKLFARDRVHESSGGRQVPTWPLVAGGENFAIAKVLEE